MRIFFTICHAILALNINAQMSTFMKRVDLGVQVHILGSDQLPDGGLVLCGSMDMGNYDRGFLSRIDSAGNTVWTREFQVQYNGSSYPAGRITAVMCQSDSVFLAVAQISDTIGDGRSSVVAFNGQGDTLRTKVCTDDHILLEHISPRTSGVILLGGIKNSIVSPSAVVTSFNLLDFLNDPAPLNISNVQLFNHSGGGDRLVDCVPAPGGGAYCSGNGSFSSLDAQLDPLWTRKFDLGGVVSGNLLAVAPDSSLLLIGGNANTTEMGFARVSPTGVLLWAKDLDAANVIWPTDMLALPDGGALVVGTRAGPTRSIWLMRLDASGDVEWNKRFGGVGDTLHNAKLFRSSSSGYITIVCTLGQTAFISEGPGDGMIIRVDSMGEGTCTLPPFPVTSSAVPSSISSPGPVVNTAPWLFVGAEGLPNGVNGLSTIYCATIGTTVPDPEENRGFIFPNPFSDRSTISCPWAISRIELIDLHGRVVRTLQGNGTREVMIERGALQSGLYMVRVMDVHGQRAALRVVVQ
jgi:Secretion system C-terminal sorting domain